MYQRLSAHINSVDIPDFSELKETARETANRVETVLARGSSSSIGSAGNSNLPPSGLADSGESHSRTASVSSATGIEPATTTTSTANKVTLRSKSVRETIEK